MIFGSIENGTKKDKNKKHNKQKKQKLYRHIKYNWHNNDNNKLTIRLSKRRKRNMLLEIACICHQEVDDE
jgi:hypothetical protein